MDSGVVIALISVVGTLGTAYIINVAAKKVQVSKDNKQPKDRIEQIFDGYDKALKQRDLDIVDLRTALSEARHNVLVITEKLEDTERTLEQTCIENKKLQSELQMLRQKYRHEKAADTAV